MIGGNSFALFSYTALYDPRINHWQYGPTMIRPRYGGCLAVVKDSLVFYIGGFYSQSVDMLDLSSESPCWKPTVDMLHRRGQFGVGVINNRIYAVSYIEI